MQFLDDDPLIAKKDFGVQAALDAYFEELSGVLAALPREKIAAAVKICDETRRKNRTVYLCGNGGSAAAATHFAADLSKVAYVPGCARFRTCVLSDNTSTLTAYSNDESYDRAFRGQMEGLATRSDLLIGISTSGISASVVEAFAFARSEGMSSIAITRDGDTPLSRLATAVVSVRPARIQVMEDAQMAVLHAISIMLRFAAETECSGACVQDRARPTSKPIRDVPC